MIQRTPISTRTDTLFPDTTLCRSEERAAHPAAAQGPPRCAFHLPASRPAPSAGQHARWLAVRRLPHVLRAARMAGAGVVVPAGAGVARSEEHTSELPSLMRSAYAVFCLKKKTITSNNRRRTI